MNLLADKQWHDIRILDQIHEDTQVIIDVARCLVAENIIIIEGFQIRLNG